MRPGVRRPQGFTLLEALVAGAIFFVAVVAISAMSVQGATNASVGMRYAQTARVATQELEKYSMMGYAALQVLTGGVSPWSPAPYPIAEQPDGGGRQYNVTVTVLDSSGPPGPPGALPAPQIGSASFPIKSYFVTVQVVSTPGGGGNPVTVTQATYVSN